MKFFAWLTTYVLIILCELGDKTQVAVLMLSSNHPGKKWLILGASALALSCCVLIEVTVGATLARYIGPQIINKATGWVFLFVGLYTLGSHFNIRQKIFPRQQKVNNHDITPNFMDR
ncbi:TMEM165/GDT1 family protein [Desulfotomaculum nigrificans]|nr:TMEM165/GDT1 family protein [Desulfotomaculum nigrificans]